MSNTYHAKGLQDWITILDEHLLPVLPASARKVGRLLKSDDASLHDIGDVIASDPIMRLHVVRECNRQFGERAAGTLANAHHCASMLGLDKLNILMRQFKATKGDANDPRDYLYFQAISISLHAAEQAASWSQFRNQASRDQMFLSALLYGVPNWCLWRFAQQEMHVINTLFQRELIPLPEAEQAVLGCTREEISNALAQRWHFPDDIRAALSSAKLPTPQFLLRCAHHHEKDKHYRIPNRTADGHLVNTPALAISLSNALAQEASRDWYSKQSRRCLAIIAGYLDQPLDDIVSLTHQVAISTSDRWPLPGTQAPASNLLWPLQAPKKRRLNAAQLPEVVARLYAGQLPADASQPTIRSQPKKPTATATAPKKPHIGIRSEHLPDELDRNAILNAPKLDPGAPPPAVFPGFVSADKKREFEQLMNKLLSEPDYFSTEYESIRCVVDILESCTHLQRVIVATLDKASNSVNAYYALGCEEAPLLKKFSVKTQPSNLFTQLMKKPAATWISPERSSSVAGLVPGSFKQASQNDEFMLMSYFNHRGACGVYFADKGLNSRTGLSDAEYKIFKAACTTCSKHLIARGKRAAAKRSPR